ncbi:MAG: DUF5596 domain-containing protein [Clostridia bacterium]|nr:DUF5596 domain-containing protein [Clostridia bacterium]
MVQYDVFEKAGILLEDIPYVMEFDRTYGKMIEEIANDYKTELFQFPFKPMDNNTFMKEHRKSTEFVKIVSELSPEHSYTLQLIFWLYLVPYMEENYKKYNIDKGIFRDTAANISYKVNECKNVYGVVGVFTSWFFLEQELNLFALGRLQYNFRTYECNDYQWGDYTLRKGDSVYSCHIPSSGPLKEEDCILSFKKAYEFFDGAKLKCGILPILCQSWLLYPPYIEKVYDKNSNLKKFAKMFDVVRQIDAGRKFDDCWRVFNTSYKGSSKGLPDDTRLRQNMISYIDNYGVFGIGEGIILFDGEKIVNRE